MRPRSNGRSSYSPTRRGSRSPRKTPFTFVNDGIESALEQAKAAAGDKNIGVMGANVAPQFIKAGLLDEMQIHLIPVFLDGGVRLLDHLGIEPTELECTKVMEAPGVTHLRFRIVGKETV